MTETVLEPDLPIIDAHHHLWDFGPALDEMPPVTHPFDTIFRTASRYLFEELAADTGSGHNVIGTVYVECHAFYRADGPVEFQPVGEVEHVNGVAARFASGVYGPTRGCAAIVGHADLTGADAGGVLEALQQAGNGRFRGIRDAGAYDADATVLGPVGRAPAGLNADPGFRAGFAHLGRLGLTFDAWVLEPQIGEVADLARAFPDVPIMLDHVGTPLGIGAYAGRLDERFDVWREAIRDIARCPNVMVKLGGLGMPFTMLPGLSPEVRPTSEVLADLWKPYVETCIEAFGPERGVFESNFPVDQWGADYVALWNAFKRLAAGASADDKRELFAGSAARFYALTDLLAASESATG